MDTEVLDKDFQLQRGILFERFPILANSFKATCSCVSDGRIDITNNKDPTEDESTMPRKYEVNSEIVLHLPCLWSLWSPWSFCSGRCGELTSVRRRRIVLQHRDGRTCPGDAQEATECFTNECYTEESKFIQNETTSQSQIDVQATEVGHFELNLTEKDSFSNQTEV